MFVICRDGHMGLYSKDRVFIEKESYVTISRKQCLEYLTKFISKEKAVDVITSMQKNPMTWYSF